MKSELQLLLEAKAKIFKALGHPARLHIVELLSKEEKCVCELRDAVGSDISTVSRHLSVLKNANIVVDEKRSNQVYYSLKIPCVLNFLPCVETMLREVSMQEQRWLKEQPG